MHGKGIIHRDIKPANALVDERGTVKLADFGASKEIKGGAGGKTLELENQTLKGTPYFMAPEVMTQAGHGRKADIWSIGATVMQMKTGTPPWKAHKFDSIIQLMCHIASDATALPMLPSIEEVGQELHSFLTHCFQRDPNLRPSCHELAGHVFLAFNSSCIIQEENDPMMNTLARIDNSASFMSPKNGGGGGGGGGGGSPFGSNNKVNNEIDANSSVMSDLSLSFSLVGGETVNVSGGDEDEEANQRNQSVEGGSSNPFSRDSKHFETEGHVIASTNFDQDSSSKKKVPLAEKLDDWIDDWNDVGSEAQSEIRNGSMTTGSIVEKEMKKKKKKKKKNKPLRPGKKRMAESIQKIEQQQSKGQSMVQVDEDEGSETMMTNSWTEREERPINSIAHQQNVKALMKREKAKEEADRLYEEELEFSRTVGATYDLSGADGR